MKSLQIRRLSIAIIFASLFVVLSFIPIGTSLIGGSGLFSLSLILPPVVGWLLGPSYGSFSMIMGSLAYTFLSPLSSFGLLAFIIPSSGAFFSGLNRKGFSLVTTAYLCLFSLSYVIIYPIVWWFIIPHLIAVCFSVLFFLLRHTRISIFLSSFSSTFSQQATGLILTIVILQLKAEIYYIIFPSMIYERVLAGIGSFLLISAIEKRLNQYTTF
jgi:hypothetical protein